MNWRLWLYTKLTNYAPLNAIVPVASVFAAGSLTGKIIPRPFLVFKTGPLSIVLRDGGVAEVTRAQAEIWIHDEPGSYERIDNALATLWPTLVGPVPDITGVFCEWEGDSAELADDEQGTILRVGYYRLTGKAS